MHMYIDRNNTCNTYLSRHSDFVCMQLTDTLACSPHPAPTCAQYPAHPTRACCQYPAHIFCTKQEAKLAQCEKHEFPLSVSHAHCARAVPVWFGMQKRIQVSIE
jgi:hypothetical protein